MKWELIFDVADEVINLLAKHGCSYQDAKEVFEKVDIKLSYQSIQPSETESL